MEPFHQEVKLAFMDVSPPEYVADGYNKVYAACTNYFDGLIAIQNQTAFAGDVAGASASTSATVLSLVKASAVTVGSVAAGIGGVSSIIKSFDDRALVTPYPDETKSLILEALRQFATNAPPSTTNTPGEAIERVQHYAELCTYSGISRFAKMALSQARPQAENGPRSILTGADLDDARVIATSLDVTALSDKQYALLYWYLFGKISGQEVWKDTKASTAIMSQFSIPVWTVFLAVPTLPTVVAPDAVAKTGFDMDQKIKDIKNRLDSIYKRNDAFKKLVKELEAIDTSVPAKLTEGVAASSVGALSGSVPFITIPSSD
jgi:hypothetical protein